jgi:hypothetical protein
MQNNKYRTMMCVSEFTQVYHHSKILLRLFLYPLLNLNKIDQILTLSSVYLIV